MDVNKIREKISDSEVILVGIGKEFALCEKEENKTELLECYNKLASLVEGKRHFIITTNTDALIYESGLERDKIVAPCGDIHRWQCKDACTKEVWDVKPETCPHCNGEVVPNIWTSKPYVEEGYISQWQVYTRWLTYTINRKLVLLELGEGFETPTVMRWPFEKIAYMNEKAYLIRVGAKFSQITEELSNKAMSVSCHSLEFVKQL
ncbi:MAG: hypothetical protein ACLRZ7_03090 [Lachnospiraceae bacterium]